MTREEQNRLIDELRDYDRSLPVAVWEGICRQGAAEIQRQRARIAELEREVELLSEIGDACVYDVLKRLCPGCKCNRNPNRIEL